MLAYHGSDNLLTEFNTPEVFVAKSVEEASRYGKYVHIVSFSKFKFETPTIYVLFNRDAKIVGNYEDKDNGT